MSGWLILWLSMTIAGFAVFVMGLAAVFSIAKSDGEELYAGIIGALGFVVCGVGALGTLGWLIAWGFG